MTKSEAESFQHQQRAADHLVIWCITTNTKDFGDKFTCRPVVVPNLVPDKRDGYLIADSLDEIREMLPPGLSWLDRNPADDPVIVETWL